jgi:uncharacterized protein YjbI with pentapeptide repeats
MEEKPESLWQKINQYSVITAVIIGVGVLVTALIIVIILGYRLNWSWVGVNGGESKITVTSISKGTSTTTELQPEKTLWDWLGLLGVIAIPVVVGLFTFQQGRASEANRRLRVKESQENRKSKQETDFKIAEDNRQEAALQAYIDKMSELILHEDLLNENRTEGARRIARQQTLTTLPRLDAKRKGIVIRFLSESELNDVIYLDGADLHSANLMRAPLKSAHLSRADLTRANLLKADLTGADLSKADLSGASLKGVTGITIEELENQTKLLKGAIMPDGKMYSNSRGVDLSGVDLSGVDLSGIDLTRADLSGVNFRKANLSNATLCNAILSNADLSKADLTGADLSGANLQGVIGITIEKLEKQTKSLKGATMPDESILE